MNSIDLIKDWSPPAMIRFARILLASQFCGRRVLCLTGDYASWQDALADSTGYNAPLILEKTREACLKVKQGQAAYERDGALFHEPACNWPLLAGLLRAATRNGGRLHVLDFGGSLGSAWFQHRAWFKHLPDVRWNIVEQPAHVDLGQQDFADNHLRFHASIESCIDTDPPDVILLSSVLQYLEEPYDQLARLAAIGCPDIIIDRTPFHGGPKDRLCIQHVPARIYAARYPAWILARERILTLLAQAGYQTTASFDTPDRLPAPIPCSYQGLLLEQRTNQEANHAAG